MSLSTISGAIEQYNENCLWEDDQTKARACLESIRYLLINRPRQFDDQSKVMTFSSLAEEKKRIETFLDIQSAADGEAPFVRAKPRLW